MGFLPPLTWVFESSLADMLNFLVNWAKGETGDEASLFLDVLMKTEPVALVLIFKRKEGQFKQKRA